MCRANIKHGYWRTAGESTAQSRRELHLQAVSVVALRGAVSLGIGWAMALMHAAGQVRMRGPRVLGAAAALAAVTATALASAHRL
jgi:hypothetical protein